MNNDIETELKLACAKLQLLIILDKAHPSQEDIDREWDIAALTSTQKRKSSMK
jgi:hypothetical protein